MGAPVRPQPVKLFTGILYSNPDVLPAVRQRMEEEFGPVDYVSPDFPFVLTDYYESEMGRPITRTFWSFSRLLDPAFLSKVKIFTNSVEMEFMNAGGGRSVNLDPGYLDFYKLILASVKDRAQKIYLDRGIYADPTLYYLKGKWYAYEWSLPDFRPDTYYEVFQQIRQRYRQGMREFRFGDIVFSGFDG